MARVLLDFPWDLTDVLNSYSPVLGVLRRFETLRATYHMQPVAFISESECSELWSQIPQRRPHGANVFQPLMILLSHSVRQGETGCLATTVAGPLDLSETWRSSLRAAMTDLEDWRNPLILFSDIRKGDWPNTPEVQV